MDSYTWAWSDESHIAICEIALLEVGPLAREHIQELQGKETDPRFGEFPTACTWPDHPPRRRRKEHFVNVSRDQAIIQGGVCPIGDRCLFTAIEQDMSVIASRTSSEQAQWEALKYLGHWIGDIHQPLHVAFPDDKGGNDITMVDEEGCLKTLHAAWDHCIPERIMSERGIADPHKFGLALYSEITTEERLRWRSEIKMVQWANESLEIALNPTVDYCVKIGRHCQYDEHRATLEAGQQKKMMALDNAYMQANGHHVTLRLKQAGIRLAALIETLLPGK